MPAATPPPSERKVELGQYYTTGDPFALPGFHRWMGAIPAGAVFVEPFAGANNLVRGVNRHYSGLVWHSYDVEPADPAVAARDTLTHFPTFAGQVTAVVTNPPYMARNVARRQGRAAVVRACGPWDNLYKRCLATCLDHSDYVAAIVPESFITARDLRDRLDGVISLTAPMFDDTDVPVCLALFVPQPRTDFTLWRDGDELGSWAALTGTVPVGGSDRVVFNDPVGPVALLALDGTAGPSIRFAPGADVDPGEVKASSRHRTRIRVRGLDPALVGPLADEANRVLAEVRAATADVALTAFRGVRADGAYRRRLDYRLARAILTAALRQVEASPALPAAAGQGT